MEAIFFPAVAPLIIHQTIVLGLCMLLAGYREQKQWKPNASEFWAIFSNSNNWLLGCFYLFGFTFWLYIDYPRGGNFIGMLIAVPIFISCIIGLAMFSILLDMPERAGHLVYLPLFPYFTLWHRTWHIAAMPLWLQGLGEFCLRPKAFKCLFN